MKDILTSESFKSEIQTAKNRFMQGMEALKKNDFAMAAELFSQAVYIDKSNADYQYYLAISCRKLQRFHDARTAIKEAITLDSKNPDYIAESGNIFLELGFHLRAKSEFEKALKINPDNKKALDGMKKLKKISITKKVEWL